MRKDESFKSKTVSGNLSTNMLSSLGIEICCYNSYRNSLKNNNYHLRLSFSGPDTGVSFRVLEREIWQGGGVEEAAVRPMFNGHQVCVIYTAVNIDPPPTLPSRAYMVTVTFLFPLNTQSTVIEYLTRIIF